MAEKKIVDLTIELPETEKRELLYFADAEGVSLDTFVRGCLDQFIKKTVSGFVDIIFERVCNICEDGIEANAIFKKLVKGMSVEDLRQHADPDIVTPLIFGQLIEIARERLLMEAKFDRKQDQ